MWEVFVSGDLTAHAPSAQELHEVTAEVWGPLAGFGDEQIATMLDAGYYSLLIQDGLRLLVYNSNFGFVDYFSTHSWVGFSANSASGSAGPYIRRNAVLFTSFETSSSLTVSSFAALPRSCRIFSTEENKTE